MSTRTVRTRKCAFYGWDQLVLHGEECCAILCFVPGRAVQWSGRKVSAVIHWLTSSPSQVLSTIVWSHLCTGNYMKALAYCSCEKDLVERGHENKPYRRHIHLTWLDDRAIPVAINLPFRWLNIYFANSYQLIFFHHFEEKSIAHNSQHITFLLQDNHGS